MIIQAAKKVTAVVEATAEAVEAVAEGVNEATVPFMGPMIGPIVLAIRKVTIIVKAGSCVYPTVITVTVTVATKMPMLPMKQPATLITI